jgi:hypothetical protein
VRRALAALAAVAMVVGAVLVRQHVEDGDGGAHRGDRIRLVCGTDLGPACGQLADADPSIALTIEDEGVTADRLVRSHGGAPGFDAWLAAGPWPGVVADDRSRAGRTDAALGAASGVLARSPATIVARRDRSEALAAACRGAVTWACIGRFAGQPWTAAGGRADWGTLKAGLAAPVGGAGLVALAQAVASQVGRADWAGNDLDDPATAAWFDQLVGTARDDAAGAQTPLTAFLRLPGSLGVAGALESEAGPSVGSAADGPNLRVLYPEPVATADVTMIPAPRGNADEVIDRIGRSRLLDALAATGWRVPGRAAADGVGGGPALPSGDGLPSPGVLQRLRDQWAGTR